MSGKKSEFHYNVLQAIALRDEARGKLTQRKAELAEARSAASRAASAKTTAINKARAARDAYDADKTDDTKKKVDDADNDVWYATQAEVEAHGKISYLEEQCKVAEKNKNDADALAKDAQNAHEKGFSDPVTPSDDKLNADAAAVPSTGPDVKLVYHPDHILVAEKYLKYTEEKLKNAIRIRDEIIGAVNGDLGTAENNAVIAERALEAAKEIHRKMKESIPLTDDEKKELSETIARFREEKVANSIANAGSILDSIKPHLPPIAGRTGDEVTHDAHNTAISTRFDVGKESEKLLSAAFPHNNKDRNTSTHSEVHYHIDNAHYGGDRGQDPMDALFARIRSKIGQGKSKLQHTDLFTYDKEFAEVACAVELAIAGDA